MPSTTIRTEGPGDLDSIYSLSKQAFANHPHGSHNEHFIIDALRRADALAVSLVAELAGAIVGHIAFSPVSISDGSSGWYGLGPVSVSPDLQGQGIGTSLILRGLELLRGQGAQGCVLLGEPLFYRRFGFVSVPGLLLSGVPPEYFMCLAFGAQTASGEVSYHPAFKADA